MLTRVLRYRDANFMNLIPKQGQLLAGAMDKPGDGKRGLKVATTNKANPTEDAAVNGINKQLKDKLRPDASRNPKKPQRQAKRRSITQSENIPDKASDSDSESESDLPDAQSLLMTPETKKKPPAKRKKTASGATIIELPTAAVSPIRPSGLMKSVSELLPAVKEDDIDDLGDIQTLRVPGELVLAVYRREYYPARIVSSIGKNRYRVEFFDGYKSSLKRSSMFTMYDAKFKTCRLGRFQLIGDEPAVRRTSLGTVDLEKDFERDMRVFRDLVKQVQGVKEHLDQLHQCPKDEVDKVAEAEYRVATFFGGDAGAKRLLASQVSSGFLNRAEFDFLGRLLSRWYENPPCAAGIQTHTESKTQIPKEQSESVSEPSSPKSVLTDATDATEVLPEEVVECSVQHNTDADAPVSETADGTEPRTELEQSSAELEAVDRQEGSSLALRFVYDVLVPHAIRRMTVNREGCSLEESEELMRSKNTENQWVEHILAARGISLETWL
ncbi:hypothetical protein H4R99_004858 [Coemansia sp. RSA 1722]|nr:hypothetical protein H4R99_004858 [Coemansia sp. RSA 1722]